MKCPKCGSTENIKFFVRHQKSSEDDESNIANCITIIHAEPQCGFNESYLLEDCLNDIFPNWSELQELQTKIEDIQNNINMRNLFDQVVETEGEIIEDCDCCQLPPIEEVKNENEEVMHNE